MIIEVNEIDIHLIHYVIQIEYIVVETFVFPSCADVVVCVGLALVNGGRILYHFVQYAQFLEHLSSNHVSIAIFRRHNDTSKSTYTRYAWKNMGKKG